MKHMGDPDIGPIISTLLQGMYVHSVNTLVGRVWYACAGVDVEL
jgi:hypothetical protein